MVEVAGSLIPGVANTPLDQRSRVATLADVANIENPVLGAIFYCVATGKHYKIVSLKNKQITPALVSADAQVDRYEAFGATDAAAVSIADADNHFTAGNVEGALAEIGAVLDGLETTLGGI